MMVSGKDDIPEEHRTDRAGKWLPQDHRVHKAWLGDVIEHVDSNLRELHPVIKEFQELIVGDTRLHLLFSNMFDQIPNKKPYKHDPTGHRQVRDYEHMLSVLNHLLTTAPSWSDKSERVGMVGLPINALLDWPMGTHSGFAVFLDPTVNAMIKKVLNAWGEHLKSPASADVLGSGPNGWFGKTGVHELSATANDAGETSYAFEDLYQCDPSAEHYGFKSWDDFFTRLFRFEDGIRPVASPSDDSIIVNACESEPYNVAYNVSARDKFWVKGQPYSVVDMLPHEPLATHFIGGTVYQAFLSALSYHRWHSPVSGKIVKAYVVDGTYYSEPPFEDFSASHGAYETGETTGQGYISATATRAIILIEADNPAIGLVAFLGIGMAEVSTRDITVKENQRVAKGEQIGMFHFGGSTYCLMFRKGVHVKILPSLGRGRNVPVRSKLAIIEG